MYIPRYLTSPISENKRKKQVSEALQKVAHKLHNTSTVCKSNYIDPYLIETYMNHSKKFFSMFKRAKTKEETIVIPPFKFPVRIYTDGACEPNPGSSGSGLVVYEDDRLVSLRYGYHEPQGTNNTAELIALREAFKIAIEYVERDPRRDTKWLRLLT